MPALPQLLGLVAASFLVAPQGSVPQEPAGEVRTFRFNHENILGTSMHLEVRAEEGVARKAKADLFAEIERLRTILSTYDPKSELRLLARPCPPTPASAELRAVMHEVERWSLASNGAFHPGVERLTQLWSEAAKRGSPPTDAELEEARREFGQKLWSVDDAQGTVALLTGLPLTFDALAKGFIIDRAMGAAKAAGAKDVVLEIGGDVLVCGESSSRVFVADPKNPEDNADALCELDLRGAAVATSGGYARGFDVGGKHYSHIFDPRTGRPVEGVLQATVIAPDATTADALATILNVVTPEEGLALVAKTPGAACLVVDARGAQHASPGWATFARKRASGEAASAPALPSVLPGGGEIVLAFELQKPSSEGGGGRRPPEGGPENRGGRGGRDREGRGGSYRRPYVAAWIETEAGRPARTLCLWIEKPRWIDDLRRWSGLYPRKQDDVRAVTRATRSAGAYELAWNGRDDAGKPLPPGKYTVFLEVVREHGTYQLLSHAIEVDGKPFSTALEGSGIEVKSATVSWRAPATDK